MKNKNFEKFYEMVDDMCDEGWDPDFHELVKFCFESGYAKGKDDMKSGNAKDDENFFADDEYEEGYADGYAEGYRDGYREGFITGGNDSGHYCCTDDYPYHSDYCDDDIDYEHCNYGTSDVELNITFNRSLFFSLLRKLFEEKDRED